MEKFIVTVMDKFIAKTVLLLAFIFLMPAGHAQESVSQLHLYKGQHAALMLFDRDRNVVEPYLFFCEVQPELRRKVITDNIWLSMTNIVLASVGGHFTTAFDREEFQKITVDCVDPAH